MAAVVASPRSFKGEELEMNQLYADDQQNGTISGSAAMKKKYLKHFSFNYEPSKVESQLKESIQRLNTPADEKEKKLAKHQDSGYNGSEVAAFIHDVGTLLTSLESSIGKEREDGDAAKDTVEDDWEIPFQDIRDLEFVGSGAQGIDKCHTHRIYTANTQFQYI